jgi:hydroxymethylglutaryl-CoA lyase
VRFYNTFDKGNKMHLPRKVKVVEVGPRDGLQNEKQSLPTHVKIDFINRLSSTGLKVIETASFVSPKLLPQMADGADIVQGIIPVRGITFPVLTPNIRGFNNGIAAGAKAVQVIASASETFSEKNANCSTQVGLDRCREIIAKASAKDIKVRGYISCCFGCPYEGNIPLTKVVSVAQSLFQSGCFEIAISDTTGVATPKQIQEVIQAVSQHVPITNLAVHLHDTYGQALANILAALQVGVTVVDGSVAGLGGCPYAKGATGNVATEDVVYMLNGLNIETGINLPQLIAAGKFICDALHKKPHSKVNLATDISTIPIR